MSGRFDKLFSLGKGLIPTELADSLSVERIGYDVPPRLYPVLVAFRKLRRDQRESAARTYMARRRKERT